MTSSGKLMRVFTILRSDADPEKVPLEQYDKLLAEPVTPESMKARDEFIHTFHLLLSGKLRVTLDNKQVSFNGKFFPQRG